jgi:hypothetical protein
LTFITDAFQLKFGENAPNPGGKGPGYFSRIRVENSGEPRKLRIELPCGLIPLDVAAVFNIG